MYLYRPGVGVMIPRVSQDIDKSAARAAQPTRTQPPRPAKPHGPWDTRQNEWFTTTSPLSFCCKLRSRARPFLCLDPWEGWKAIGHHQVHLPWQGQARSPHSARTTGTGISGQTPSLRASTQTRQHRGAVTTGMTPHHPNSDRQDGRTAPPTIGWGARPRRWLPRPAKPPEALTSQSGVEATNIMTSKGDRLPESGHMLPHYRHDANRRTEDDDEYRSKTTSRWTVGEPPPCR
jgi:hypothetical protein